MSGRIRTRRSIAALTSAAVLAGVVLTVADGQSAVMAQSTMPAQASTINLTQQDLEFIMRQIIIAEAHPDGNGTLCVAPDMLTNPLACPTEIMQNTLPFGLRQTNGQNNNLIPENALYGAADLTFPRLTSPVYQQGDPMPDMDGPGPMVGGAPTSYEQNTGMVFDAEPRMISNLIADQTEHNPAAASAAAETQGHGFGSSTVQVDHDRDATTPTITQYVIPNVAPDAGFSASYNSLFTMFGQFFDHGLDLAAKGGSGTVFVPLQADDPLYDPTSQTNFMVLTRATNQPGPDGVLGTADDIKDATNRVTPYIDNNQTYTSHPSHQVFIREYVDSATGPVSTGRLLDGAAGGLPTWNDVKAQALNKLGIILQDTDVTNVPLLATDAYGRFLRNGNGYPELVLADGTTVSGTPDTPVDTADYPNLVRTNHAFLDDIAHHAAPGSYDHDRNPRTAPVAMTPDSDPGTTDDHNPGTYDDEMLGAHYITGDGRGNENIGLTAMHHVFHEEHNGLVSQLESFIPTLPVSSPASVLNWKLPNGQWNGERIFQAAKLVNEMEYQHIVFGEFARAIQPAVNLFAGYDPSINPAISAEFAHAVYRFGHSMLTETVERTNADGSKNDISLMEAFLNPIAFTDGGSAGQLDANAGAGAVIRGMVSQRGEEIDEFVTEALRNNLVGLPLDLATLNLTRARSEGIAPLNEVRRDLYNGNVVGAAGNTALRPYADWNEFGTALRHSGSLVNFVAAYGTHPSITAETTIEGKRAAAQLLVDGTVGAPDDAQDFMDGTGAWLSVDGRSVTGLEDVDLWIGGLAERPPLFGGMLGSTFNFVFEQQLEALQDNDRLYYLARTEGLPLLAELEVNTFSDLIRRTTDASNVPVMAFTRSDYTFDLSAQTNARGIVDDSATPYNETNLDGWAKLQRLSDGTIRLRGAGASVTENHSTWLGTNGPDKVRSAEGDDSLWGNDGDDTLEGGVGGDMIEGGAGNDVLTDTAGDDVIAGGEGHDVIHGGSGLDILTGDTGDDAIFHGSDDKESFAGPGDDLVAGGIGADATMGGPGQDWLEGGAGGDFIVGDVPPEFVAAAGEDDVLLGGSGDDRYLAGGGMDIMVIGGGGTDTSAGGDGFDFATYALSNIPGFGDLSLPPLAVGGVANPRDRFSLVEGISGGPADDTLRGDDRVRAIGHELNQASMDKVTGLESLLADGGMLNPPGFANMFSGDDIVIGGDGSDMLEGGGGADLIDGDASLEVQLVCNQQSTQSQLGVTSISLIQNQLLGRDVLPSECDIDRSIQYPVPNGSIDTAVYRFTMDQYFVGLTPDGRVTVSHVPPNGGGGGAIGGGGGGQNEGTDILLNIERVQFADGTIDVSPGAINSPVTGGVAIDIQNPFVGDTLTATASVVDPDNIDLATESYTWEALTGIDPFFGTDIWEFIGSGQTHLVDAAQVGQQIRVVYSFTDGLGNFESVISDPTANVAVNGALPTPVLVLAVPAITTPNGFPVSATFTKPVNGVDTPIADAIVAFNLDGVQITATTDANGVATALFSTTALPGTALTLSAQSIDPVDPNQVVISAANVFPTADYAGLGLTAVDTITEGDAGTLPLTATVTLDGPVAHDVTVDWTATGVTATGQSDFSPVSGSTTILAGSTVGVISVDVAGDTQVEADETLDIAITGVTGGLLTGTSVLTGTIVNDDVPTMSVGTAKTAVEGGTITFDVTLDQAAFVPVSIAWSLLGGTATAGVDFTDSIGTVAFAPGETVQTVTVNLPDDTDVELDETFTLVLDANTILEATLPGANTITGTITDNDAPVVNAGQNVSVVEGGRNARTPLNFTLQLDQPSPRPVRVTWALVAGSARAGTDYVQASGSTTFTPGSVTATVTATVIGDTTAEADETFSLNITGATNALVGQASATGTILDDDTPPSAVINDVAIAEGNTGTATASFTITLSKAPTAPVSVLAEVVAGTARIPADVRTLRTTVTIPAGQRTATVAVSIVGDAAREPNETYTVRLSRAAGITLADSSGLGTVLNDD